MRQLISLIPLLGIFGIAGARVSDKKIVLPPTAKPGGNYSQGILIDGTLYISGQGGEDAAGKISGDFVAEARECLNNIGAILNAAGMSRTDLTSVQVY